MSRTSHPDQLARELMRLRTTSRLKGAPILHFWEIGQGKRDLFLGLEQTLIAFTKRERSGETFNAAEQAAFEQLKALFADPDLNPYTPELLRQDQDISALPHFTVASTFDNDSLILADPAQVTRQLLDHFHPIRWSEFEDSSDWDLLCEVLPALQIARVQLDTYTAQRWLYDERSQRAAEALCFRVQAMLPDAQLPARVPATAASHLRRLRRPPEARHERATVVPGHAEQAGATPPPPQERVVRAEKTPEGKGLERSRRHPGRSRCEAFTGPVHQNVPHPEDMTPHRQDPPR